jgi:transposase
VPDASGGARRPSYEELEARVVEQQALIERLQARVAQQEAVIEELRRQVNRNSGNSSMSPSSDRPLPRAERRRRAREAYKRSMRKTGGQPGHRGKTRELVESERVDRRFEHPPERCGCGYLFDGGEVRIGDPVVHQQYELPPITPLVCEHVRLRLCCPECGRPVLAELPGPALSGYGPRLEAHIAMLAGVFRLSHDQVRQVVTEVFGIPSCKGTIDNTLARINAILADPWAELREAVRKAETVHLDETTWRLKGAQQWLWVAASSLAACYRIDPSRSQRAAKALIGEDFGGFAVTDRYAGYHFLDILQQQLCWAHVIRQLVEISERDGVTGRRGQQLVELARKVIATHREYLEHGHQPAWLAEQLAPLREQIRTLLEQCAAGRHERTANFAAGLLDEYDALWTFADVPDAGIDPTNNTAERAMRHPVLMRRIQGGSQSTRGNRWVERIQSVRETCRLQDRRILDWLIDAATAAHHGQPISSLAPT